MMTASDRFEDRLLEQLRHVVATRPAPAAQAPRRPRRTRFVVAGAGVAAVTAAVMIVATSGDVTPSAFAVQRHGDGSVSVEIRSLRDAAGLERSLRAAGVPAVVDYAPAGQSSCVGASPEGTQSDRTPESGSRRGPSRSGPGPGATTNSIRIGRDGGVTFTIDRGDIKRGEKLYITTSTGAVSSVNMAVGTKRPRAGCAPESPVPAP
jgi:hypothetical protein